MIITVTLAISIALNVIMILVIKTQQIKMQKLKKEASPLDPIEVLNDWGGMYYDVAPDVIYEADYSPVSW